MYIYYSEEEVAIKGTVAELHKILVIISSSKDGDRHHFDALTDIKPEPYNGLLESLVLNCNSLTITDRISNDMLTIGFSELTKEIVSSHFSFEKNTLPNHHHHFDKLGNESHYSTDFFEIIVLVGDQT